MIFFTSEVFLNSGFGSSLCPFIAIVTRLLSFFMRFHEIEQSTTTLSRWDFDSNLAGLILS